MSERQTGELAAGSPYSDRSNDVNELKQFVVVHARAQNIKQAHYARVLSRIETDDGDGPGTWVGEWCAAAQRLAARNSWLEACRYYNMARFPFVNGPGREAALADCVQAFDRWRRDRPGLDSMELDLAAGRLRCWSTGLSLTEPRPLLVLMGGIVAIKEQWAPVLANIRRLGMAGIVTELPGVGENTQRYEGRSWQMLADILDAVADRADVSRTCAVALSFSGNMALRCALHDSRIGAVITAGAPIRDFFLDPAWQRTVPRVTVDTLAHLTATVPTELWSATQSWALPVEQLSRLDIPVHYMASRRDEIIPPGDVRHLQDHVRDLHLVEYDDVHGSPRHVAESRLWTTRAIMSAAGGHLAQRAVLATILAAMRGLHRRAGDSR